MLLFKRLGLSLACVFLCAVPVSWADAVSRDGKRWLQPADIAPLTWFEVNAACPAPERICVGSLNSKEVSGFKWASYSELRSLYESYLDPQDVSVSLSGSLDEFMQDFEATGEFPGTLTLVSGWTMEEEEAVVQGGAAMGFAIRVPPSSPLDSDDSSCGNNFTVAIEDKNNSSTDVCRAPFGPDTYSIGAWLWETDDGTAKAQILLEEPVNDQVHGGIGNLRGWAVSTESIERIEIYIDGAFAFNAPFGGDRPDVAQLFPTIPGSDKSGFSLAYGYSNLEAGAHTITAKAITMGGESMESSSTFTVVRFADTFVGPEKNVDTSSATITSSGSGMMIDGVSIAGKMYSVRLQWRTAKQGYEIVEIRPK